MIATCPVELFQHEAELERCLDLYRERAPARVLEIGTYHGGTLYYWLQHAAPGARVVTVDSYVTGIDNRHLYPEWCADDIDLHVIVGNSHDDDTAAKVRDLGPYDWVFIDAGHYYHEVARDWQLYGPMCAPGGVVAFHDILPSSDNHPEVEVEPLWREIQWAGYLTREIVDDPNADWGGIGICYVEEGL